MSSWSGSSSLQVHSYDKITKDYYENNMAPPYPNMIPLDAYAIVNTRKRKIIKLQALREQSLARKRQQVQTEQKLQMINQYNILHHLQNSKISDLDSNEDQALCQSYDSDVHDIYEGEKLQSRFREAFSYDSLQNILDVKLIKQSGLIIDFKLQQSNNRISFQQEQVTRSKNMQTEKSNNQYIKVASPVVKNEKKSSFIGYYNSLSKKSSNIIEKYIKSKK